MKITINVTEDLNERIEDYRREKGFSTKNAFLVSMITEYLNQQDKVDSVIDSIARSFADNNFLKEVVKKQLDSSK